MLKIESKQKTKRMTRKGLMHKHSDYAFLKQNELLNYFIKRELKAHLSNQEEIDKKRIDSFVWPIFSLVLTVSFTYYMFESGVRKVNAEVLFNTIVLCVLYLFSYFIIYKIIFKFIFLVLFRILKYLKDQFVSSPIISSDEETLSNDCHHFNIVTVSQISISRNLIYKIEQVEKDSELELFYAYDALYYLKKAVAHINKIATELLNNEKKKIIHEYITAYRLNNAIELCKQTINYIENIDQSNQDLIVECKALESIINSLKTI